MEPQSKVKRHWGPQRTAELVAFLHKLTPEGEDPDFRKAAEEAMKSGLYSLSTGMNNVRYSLMGAWLNKRKYPLPGRLEESRMLDKDRRANYQKYENAQLKKEKFSLEYLEDHPVRPETWEALRAILDKAGNETAQRFWSARSTISGPAESR